MPSAVPPAEPADPPPGSTPPPVRDHLRREATDAEARALASGLRLRILRLTLDEPLSNREIAEALRLNPATVLHHVRTLVDTGFLEAQEPRRGRRGAREIPYRATGKSWYLSSPLGASSLVEAFLTELQAVPEEQRDLVRLGLRLPPAEMEEFRSRLADLVQEFHDRPRDPAAEPWSFFAAVHPDTSQRRP
ncbi:winged helix-turn-helix domain-containing protein [Ornithinimicrobium cerasi]|uniref:winged helix-turn-helix domain-containing protein n=1 Tax=Ornithinimicrobium cerasi TaxID=2248773 RepID=UPI000BE34C49|nr:winged helix-turn-helix domain-containing protein [Ornithinimicrobium cerasi]